MSEVLQSPQEKAETVNGSSPEALFRISRTSRGWNPCACSWARIYGEMQRHQQRWTQGISYNGEEVARGRGVIMSCCKRPEECLLARPTERTYIILSGRLGQHPQHDDAAGLLLLLLLLRSVVLISVVTVPWKSQVLIGTVSFSAMRL